MQFIDTESGDYPLTEYQIKQANPHVSFPHPFVSERFRPVVPMPAPAFDDATQYVTEVAPINKGTHWEQAWEVVALDAETVAANVERAKAALIAAVESAVQSRLDAFARSRNYDGILSACTYATSTVAKFKAEGQYCVDARDAHWAACYSIMADVESGARAMPTVAEVLSEMPALVWPA